MNLFFLVLLWQYTRGWEAQFEHKVSEVSQFLKIHFLKATAYYSHDCWFWEAWESNKFSPGYASFLYSSQSNSMSNIYTGFPNPLIILTVSSFFPFYFFFCLLLVVVGWVGFFVLLVGFFCSLKLQHQPHPVALYQDNIYSLSQRHSHPKLLLMKTRVKLTNIWQRKAEHCDWQPCWEIFCLWLCGENVQGQWAPHYLHCS